MEEVAGSIPARSTKSLNNFRQCFFAPAVSDRIYKRFMARPERFELPAFWFVARRSIQLS